MRWNSFADERLKRISAWHLWFAWRPVRLSHSGCDANGPWVWLEPVQRRLHYGMFFIYKDVADA